MEEFVPGLSLEKDTVVEGDSKAYMRILYQIACALSDIHAHNRVHRDVKPQNLKFDLEGIIKILDFGITTNIAQDSESVKARGTRPYLAPEFYQTPPIPITPAVDVYAFAVTAWYIGDSGHVPDPLLETPPQAYTTAPSFSTLKLSLAPEVVRVLDAALSIDPSDRPTMVVLRDTIAKRLLYGQHRTVIREQNGQNHHVLSDPGKSVIIRVGAESISIKYDGLSFIVDGKIGDVYINNTPITSGHLLPGPCVITFGRPQLQAQRKFIALEMSRPEVVL